MATGDRAAGQPPRPTGPGPGGGDGHDVIEGTLAPEDIRARAEQWAQGFAAASRAEDGRAAEA
jgi:hypothetical protein